MRLSLLPIQDMNDGLDNILNNFYKNGISHPVLEFGLYGKYIKLFEDYLKNNQLLILFHEEIISEPLVALNKIYKYLGIQEDFVPISIKKRPQKVAYDLNLLKFRKLSNTFYYEFNKNGGLIARKNTDPRWVTFLLQIPLNILKLMEKLLVFLRILDINKKQPKLSSKNLSRLLEFYSKDVQKLKSIINSDIKQWKNF